MKSVLLYNLYLINNWKQVSKELLQHIPQDDLYVNINFDWRNTYKIPKAILLLKKQKQLRKIFFSTNHAKLGEVKGFNNFRNKIDFSNYNIATYIHSKGVTKPNNKNVAAWRELMRYFILEKFQDTISIFNKGYCLYGALLSIDYENNKPKIQPRLGVAHWYRGTFVSINLDKIRTNFLTTPLQQNFYGIESFFGSICKYEECFNAHEVNISLYKEEYKPEFYKK